MKDFEGIIFDMDGVLVDSEETYAQSWVDAAAKYGVTGKEILACHSRCVGRSKEDCFRILTEDFGNVFDAHEFYQLTDRICQKLKFSPKKGALETVSFLKDENIPFSIATSNEMFWIEKLLTETGLKDFFDLGKIVTSLDVKKSKPDPEIYLKCAEKNGLDPKKCLAVEDSPNGVLSAAGAGMRCVMIPDRIQPDERIRNVAWKVLPDLWEFRRLLEN